MISKLKQTRVVKEMVAGLEINVETRLTFAQSLGSVGVSVIPILCDALKTIPML